MADDNHLLKQIKQIVHEATEPIQRQLNARGKQLDLQGEKLDAQGKMLEEHGKKLDAQGKQLEEHSRQLDTITQVQQAQGKKLDILLAESGHTRSAIKALDSKIEATKAEVDKIKKRQRPHKAD